MQFKIMKLVYALIIASGLINHGTAYAVSCGTTAGLDTSDVTYSVTGASPFTNATDCAGVISGNINAASDANGVFGATPFLDLGNNVSLFGGTFDFSLTGSFSGTSGNYTLSAIDNNGATAPNFPIALDFFVALKASDRYALYFFDNATFDGSGGGAWSIHFVNNGGQIPDLSHMLIGVREGEGTTTTTTTTTGTQTTTGGNVPEPSALILLGVGLLTVARRVRGYLK